MTQILYVALGLFLGYLLFHKRTPSQHTQTVSERYRLQLDFEEEDSKKINQLRQDGGFKSRLEMFIAGIRVLRWMYLKKRQGCIIAAVTPDHKFIEPSFEFLQNVEPAQVSS